MKKKRMGLIKYMKITWKNKLVALGLAICGVIPMLFEYDATVFVFFIMIGIPLFFSKENWVEF